ncbi:MAG TPA: hypothetical protein VFJ12_10705 [Segeticoccus sp.]|nr:hypothetical protein [Segeticoccus sp.]
MTVIVAGLVPAAALLGTTKLWALVVCVAMVVVLVVMIAVAVPGPAHGVGFPGRFDARLRCGRQLVDRRGESRSHLRRLRHVDADLRGRDLTPQQVDRAGELRVGCAGGGQQVGVGRRRSQDAAERADLRLDGQPFGGAAGGGNHQHVRSVGGPPREPPPSRCPQTHRRAPSRHA